MALDQKGVRGDQGEGGGAGMGITPIRKIKGSGGLPFPFIIPLFPSDEIRLIQTESLGDYRGSLNRHQIIRNGETDPD